MTNWRRWIAVKRYRWAVLLHALRDPIRYGDPLYGRDRETRNKNIRLMSERWDAKGPRPEDFGLPADTAPTKHLEREAKHAQN